MRSKATRWIWMVILVSALMCGAFLSHAEDEVPVSFDITAVSDDKLETAGTVGSLTFSLSNDTDEPYTLYHAKLSGGFDGEVRALNDEITVEANSTREFSLSDVAVTEDQLDTDIVYILSWDEMVVKEMPAPEPDVPEGGDETGEGERIPEDGEDPSSENEGESESGSDASDNHENPAVETVTEFIPRSLEASVRIERFVPPELGISAESSSASAAEGETFSVTYIISNDTKYDMSGIMLTDEGVYDGAIPIPATELMAGASITVTIDYTMGDQDMVFHPAVSYVASQRQFESRPEEPVIVGSVVTAIKIEVEQYPSNVEGSTFAITVTNIGNRTLTGLQLYDEINTEIDDPFDLAAQQQKVVTFNVPSAYSAGLIRTVRFRVTGYDYFGDPFSYTDVNSYDCIPYITSDEVRLSVLASVRNAYYDESGKLCGEILLEIRNYSDVRLTNAILSELTLFGTLETYRELLRGETYCSPSFQLDGVPQLQFCVTANDPTGQTYTSEITVLALDQLASLAAKPQSQQIVYHSNTFLSELTEKVAASFKNAFLAAFVLVMVSTTICLVLWFIEERLKSRLPSESMIRIVVPESKTPKTSMDQVLNSSPAEQLGYTVPTKIRYGTTTIKTSANDPGKARRFAAEQPLSRREGAEHKHQESDQTGVWSRRPEPSTQAFLMGQSANETKKTASSGRKKAHAKEAPALLTEALNRVEEKEIHISDEPVPVMDHEPVSAEWETGNETLPDVPAEEPGGGFQRNKRESVSAAGRTEGSCDLPGDGIPGTYPDSREPDIPDIPEMKSAERSEGIPVADSSCAPCDAGYVTDNAPEEIPENDEVPEAEPETSAGEAELKPAECEQLSAETAAGEQLREPPDVYGPEQDACVQEDRSIPEEVPLPKSDTGFEEPEPDTDTDGGSTPEAVGTRSVRVLEIGPRVRKKMPESGSIVRVRSRTIE